MATKDNLTNAVIKQQSLSDSFMPYSQGIKKSFISSISSILMFRFRFLELSSMQNYKFFSLAFSEGSFGVYVPDYEQKFLDEKHTFYDQIIFFRYQKGLNQNKNKYGFSATIKPNPEDVRNASIQKPNGEIIELLPNKELIIDRECVVHYNRTNNNPTDQQIVNDYADLLDQLYFNIQSTLITERIAVSPRASSPEDNDFKIINKILKGEGFGLYSDPNNIMQNIKGIPAVSYDYYMNLINFHRDCLLTRLGIDNIGVNEKKEHLINREVLPALSSVQLNLGDYYTQLESFARRFQDVFGHKLTILVYVSGAYVDLSTAKEYWAIKGCGGDAQSLATLIRTGINNVNQMNEGPNVGFGRTQEQATNKGTFGNDQSKPNVPPIGDNSNNPLPIYGPFSTVEQYEKLNYFYNTKTYEIPTGGNRYINFFKNFFSTKTDREKAKIIDPKRNKKQYIDDRPISSYFIDQWNDFKARLTQLYDTANAKLQYGFALGFMPTVIALGSSLLVWGKSKNIPGTEFLDSRKHIEKITQGTYNYLEEALATESHLLAEEADEANLVSFEGVWKKTKSAGFNLFKSIVPSAIISKIVGWGSEYLMRSIIYNIFYRIGFDAAKYVGKFLPYDNTPKTAGRITGSMAIGAFTGMNQMGLLSFSLANFLDQSINDLLINFEMNEFIKWYNSIPAEILKLPITSYIIEILIKKAIELHNDPNSRIANLARWTGRTSFNLSVGVISIVFRLFNDIISEYFKETKNLFGYNEENAEDRAKKMVENIIDFGTIEGIEKTYKDDSSFMKSFLLEDMKDEYNFVNKKFENVKNKAVEDIKSELNQVHDEQKKLDIIDKIFTDKPEMLEKKRNILINNYNFVHTKPSYMKRMEENVKDLRNEMSKTRPRHFYDRLYLSGDENFEEYQVFNDKKITDNILDVFNKHYDEFYKDFKTDEFIKIFHTIRDVLSKYGRGEEVPFIDENGIHNILNYDERFPYDKRSGIEKDLFRKILKPLYDVPDRFLVVSMHIHTTINDFNLYDLYKLFGWSEAQKNTISGQYYYHIADLFSRFTSIYKKQIMDFYKDKPKWPSIPLLALYYKFWNNKI